MKARSIYALVFFCCVQETCLGAGKDSTAKATEFRVLFACQVYLPGHQAETYVIESAADYSKLREQLNEITWPTPGVRRVGSKKLRELGSFDFMRDRLVLIHNTSMADEVRVVAANSKEIRVRNVSTPANAIIGSGQLIALAVPRGPKPPRISWVGDKPRDLRPLIPDSLDLQIEEALQPKN